jgi:3-deoxy-D-manno-octulosonic-acid transferase
LSYFEILFVQNELSKCLLADIGFTNVKVTGDTRFDRVQAITSQSQKNEEVKLFIGDKKCIVIGSSWEQDEDLLSKYINESLLGVKYIIAPHEINSSHLERIEKQITKRCIRYSNWINKQSDDYDVLVIDNIGMLSSLYQYGAVAYIGGGFGKGIHNILEAAVWGCPVLFGPNYHKFQEAIELIELGGAFVINDNNRLKIILDSLFTDNLILNESGKIASDYIYRNTGATEKIVSVIMGDKKLVISN